MPGMHGHYAAVKALPGDRPAGHPRRPVRRPRHRATSPSFAPHAKVVHVDVDPAEIGKNRAVDVPIVGDVKVVLGQLLKVLEDKRGKGDLDELVPDTAAVARTTSTELKADHPLRVRAARDRASSSRRPPSAPSTPRRATTPSTSRASASTRCGRPSTSPTPAAGSGSTRGGLGTMGFAVPAAIGAKVGVGDDVPVVCHRR